jgi:PKD repeat protein
MYRFGTRPFLYLLTVYLALSMAPADPIALSSVRQSVTFNTPGFVSEDILTSNSGGTAVTDLTAFAFTPSEDKLFLAQKDGVVAVATRRPHGKYAIMSQPFVDISRQTNNTVDRGLTSIALHPDWPQTPYVYLFFAYDPPEVQNAALGTAGGPDGSGSRASRLIRLEADPAHDYSRAIIDGATGRPREVVLLGTNSTYANLATPTGSSRTAQASCTRGGVPIQDCIPIDDTSHATGQVQFGPDGALWVSHGDGAAFMYVDPKALYVQSIDSLTGKLLRINPETGLGLPDNPFFDGNPASNRSRVVSYGLRNPFRFALHPDTGEPFIGDVGWNEWEEINRGRGKNFGWPCYEGSDSGSAYQSAYRSATTTQAACAALYTAGGVTAPLYAYPHNGAYAAVLAGAFYEGHNYPSVYRGVLFMLDYSSNRIQYVTLDASGAATAHDFASQVPPWGAAVQLTPGPEGDLYYAVLNGNMSGVRRIRYYGSNTPPSAMIRADRTDGLAPLTVQFDGSSSRSQDGSAVASYNWDFGDGTTSTDTTPSHTYTTDGTYTVTLRVTDARSAVGVVTKTITVGNNSPIVQITSPISGSTYVVGRDSIRLSTTVSDVQETLGPDRIRWRALLHHGNHVHPDVPFDLAADHLSGSLSPEDHGHATWIELCVDATDSGGLTSTDCVSIYPRKITYTFTSEPSGIPLVYEGRTRITPFTLQLNENAMQQLIAQPKVGQYRFARWDDGQQQLGESSISFRIGQSPITLTAHYEVPQYLPLVMH